MTEQITDHYDIIMPLLVVADVIFVIVVVYYFFKAIKIKKKENDKE